MVLILVITSCGTLLTLLNSLTMRVVKNRDSAYVSQSISILVPMRNEESNVDGVVTSIQASRNLALWSLTALDDSSSDATLQKLEKNGVKALHGTELPEGWLGKNWACWQLAQETDGEYLVFLDADVRIAPDAIASSITLMKKLEWDFISPYPRQVARTFLERIFQPLLQWSWLASVPLRLAERLGISSMTIANGQFLIIKRSAYEAIGGHKTIRGQVLDDLRITRALIDSGFRGGVADASEVASCRMYDSAVDLVNGYTKSLWTAFGGVFGTLFTVALLFATQILPISLGVSGYAIGWVSFFIMSFSHAIAAIRTRGSLANIFLHPISTLLLMALIIESIRRKNSGKLLWRERYLP